LLSWNFESFDTSDGSELSIGGIIGGCSKNSYGWSIFSY